MSANSRLSFLCRLFFDTSSSPSAGGETSASALVFDFFDLLDFLGSADDDASAVILTALIYQHAMLLR